ncbi:MAG: DNA mismatch repair protein MutS [Acidobacteriota bacterium]|nr:MAG: DNA mismatch repair protein MutS [Acidobacteriota bacterium]
MPPADKLTPMFRQWRDAKRQHPDAVLLFRMGDFYELFFDDAQLAAPILEIALTVRGKGTACEAPMCGVPHHAVEGYIVRLIEHGHRVAVCDQVEDPKKVKGMVRREVVRVVSPGTLTDPERLDPNAGHYLAAVHPCADERLGIALVDLSTGAMVLAEAAGEEQLADTLLRYEVCEVLAAETQTAALQPVLPDVRGRHPLLTPVAEGRFEPALARSRVLETLGVVSLAGFGCADDHPALPAAAAALAHLGETQRVRPAHLDRLRVEDPAAVLTIDQTTRRNLELFRNLRDGSRLHSLLDVIDRTRTPMGARELRGYLVEPLIDIGEIQRRQSIVETFFVRSDVRRALRESLGSIRDLERLLGRAALGRATPGDLVALRASLATLPELAKWLEQLDADSLARLSERLDPLDDLHERLARALAEEPSGLPGEGRVIREGFDATLDEARELARGGRSLIARIEQRERQRTGIGSLKVRYNKVFGYFIEVSKPHLAKVPDDYERRQTVASGERFVTGEIKQLESRILSAEERLGVRERELFQQTVDEITARATRLRETAAVVAELDALAGLAELAHEEGYVRPLVDDQDRIEIEDGRHPVVERLLAAGEFVPNDGRLDESCRLLVVTGPNMGGKSTYLRQVALITLMAQIGSYVPARAARIGVVDRIFCRVGASDNLAGGESTFMVEMLETANILHNATPRSLVILDEIGRGTATWDGMAIAWSVVEHLHDDPRLMPKALFATHYHELTELAASLPRLANVHIAVREHGHDIVLLHRVEPGPSDRSYGIHVARLAGLPDRVVARAREILTQLTDNHAHVPSVSLAARAPQLPLFGPHAARAAVESVTPAREEAVEQVIERLRAADVDDLTPREAHALLSELVERLGRKN